jgi:hypothetical protein
MKKETFFSKSYVYPSIWAIIIGIFGFIGGLLWQHFSGPDKVIVLNKDQNSGQNNDTTITFIRFQPDEEYFQNLLKLSEIDLRKSYLSNKNQSTIKLNVDSIASQIAREYQFKYDSLRLAIIKNEIKKPVVLGNLIPLRDNNPGFSSTNIKRPKFKMPAIVSGYTTEQINSYATANLNSSIINRKEQIEITLDFFDQAIINKITPIIVSIVQAKGENSLYYIWGEQYELKGKRNMIVFSADFKPGKYELEIGFYLLDDLDKKYPTYYSKKFNIDII